MSMNSMSFNQYCIIIHVEFIQRFIINSIFDYDVSCVPSYQDNCTCTRYNITIIMCKKRCIIITNSWILNCGQHCTFHYFPLNKLKYDYLLHVISLTYNRVTFFSDYNIIIIN